MVWLFGFVVWLFPDGPDFALVLLFATRYLPFPFFSALSDGFSPTPLVVGVALGAGACEVMRRYPGPVWRRLAFVLVLSFRDCFATTRMDNFVSWTFFLRF